MLWPPIERAWIYLANQGGVAEVGRSRRGGFAPRDRFEFRGDPSEALSRALEWLPKLRGTQVFLAADLVKFSLVLGTPTLSERDWVAIAEASICDATHGSDLAVVLDRGWRSGPRLAVGLQRGLHEQLCRERPRINRVTPLACQRANGYFRDTNDATGFMLLREGGRCTALSWSDGALRDVVSIPGIDTEQKLLAFENRLRVQLAIPSDIQVLAESFSPWPGDELLTGSHEETSSDGRSIASPFDLVGQEWPNNPTHEKT